MLPTSTGSRCKFGARPRPGAGRYPWGREPSRLATRWVTRMVGGRPGVASATPGRAAESQSLNAAPLRFLRTPPTVGRDRLDVGSGSTGASSWTGGGGGATASGATVATWAGAEAPGAEREVM